MKDFRFKPYNKRISDEPNFERIFYSACSGFVIGAGLSLGYLFYDNLKPISDIHQTDELNVLIAFLAPMIISSFVGAGVGLFKIINEKTH